MPNTWGGRETMPWRRVIIAAGLTVMVLYVWVVWMAQNDERVMVDRNKATTSTLVVDCDRADIFCDDEGS